MDFSAYAHLWILFSLLSAFFHASRLAVTKQLGFNFSAEALTFFVNLAGLAVSLPLALRYHRIPLDQPAYLGAVLLGGLLSVLGGWALSTAIKRGEISLVGPVMTLTPACVLVGEWTLTAERPDGPGLIGLGLLIFGGYLLSLDAGAMRQPLAPLARLARNPGAALTLLAALCFAGASIFGRVAIRLSDPLSFAVVVGVVNTAMLLLLFHLRDRRFYRQILHRDALRHWRGLLLLGLLFAAMRIADQIALSLTLASYAMAVKRSGGMFSVLLGHLLFGEPHLLTRLFGSALMLGGLLALTLW